MEEELYEGPYFINLTSDGSNIDDYLYPTNSSGILINDYDDEEEYVPYGERPETYIVPVLFAIIFIIGVLGNGTLILIFLKHRSMRNVPNMYICSLAVGDLLVIFFCVPFTSTVYTVESWPYGEIICKFSEFIKDISIGVSVFTLTALSADRYFAIVDPMRKLHGGNATKMTCLTIAGVWMFSTLIAVPSVVYSYVRVLDIENHTIFICYPFPTELGPNYPKIVVMFKFLVYYAIPLVFITYFYLIMARHLLLSTRNMPGEAAQGAQSQIQGRKKVAKMVLSFVVIFAMCFFPSHVFLLWFYFDPNSEDNFNIYWNYIRIIGFCLSFMNSCINPITLWIVSGTFRKYFNQHLFCCLCPAESRLSNARGMTFRQELVSNASRAGHLNNQIQTRNGKNGNSRPYNGPAYSPSGSHSGSEGSRKNCQNISPGGQHQNQQQRNRVVIEDFSKPSQKYLTVPLCQQNQNQDQQNQQKQQEKNQVVDGDYTTMTSFINNSEASASAATTPN